jgi:ATP-dependent DNA helicase RecG
MPGSYRTWTNPPLPNPATSLDLEQLAIRESEQIEWKENVADVDSVVATLSAFANDLANLGGGYVICGAAEAKNEHGFPLLVKKGLTANRMREVEGQVLQRCRDCVSPPITPIVQELPSDHPSRRILVFIQPSTGTAHTFQSRGQGAKHFVRLSRETREARNGTSRELLVRKGVQEAWDRRICSSASVADIDLLALRDALYRMRVFSSEYGVESYISDEVRLSAFVPPLCIREPLTNELKPRNFAVLLFGRDPQKFIPGAVGLFSIYPGNDRSEPTAERHELAGTIIEQARRLGELLDVQSFTAFDKTDSAAPNAVKYPKRALYEAMGNALAHRDYEMNDPTRVTVFEDRIEVMSPGSLPYGVQLEDYRAGRASPRWRNQTLAWFFNKLQIAQAEGQGIPTILKSMQEEGCPPPIFDADDVRVLCVLPAHPRHALLREVREVEQSLAVGDFSVAQAAVTRLLARDPMNVRALQLFGEVQTALRDPAPVTRWLDQHGAAVKSLPRAVLVQLSEALMAGEEVTDSQRGRASNLLRQAASGYFEERELRKLVVAMLRSRDEQAALDIIERHIQSRPDLEDNASLQQLRGDAYIGLARKCRNVASRRTNPQAVRERSRNQFDFYTREAEKHLARAESLSVDSVLTSIIQRNREFLEGLKRWRIGPWRRHQHKRVGR